MAHIVRNMGEIIFKMLIGLNFKFYLLFLVHW